MDNRGVRGKLQQEQYELSAKIRMEALTRGRGDYENGMMSVISEATDKIAATLTVAGII